MTLLIGKNMGSDLSYIKLVQKQKLFFSKALKYLMIAYGRFTYTFCSALSDLAFDLCGSHQLSLKGFVHICFSILLTHGCKGVIVHSVSHG